MPRTRPDFLRHTAAFRTNPENGMTAHPLERWHELVRTRNPRGLDELIASDAVFHSPVVHTPQVGRRLVVGYLSAAFEVFFHDSFRYVREVRGERDAVLEFQVELDGVSVNGVDMIRWNDAGEIVDFKVMVRPLKAIQLIHRKMGEMLQRMNAPN